MNLYGAMQDIQKHREKQWIPSYSVVMHFMEAQDLVTPNSLMTSHGSRSMYPLVISQWAMENMAGPFSLRFTYEKPGD